MHGGRTKRSEWSVLVVGVAVGVWGATPVPIEAAHHPSSDIDQVRITSAYTPEAGEFEIYQVTEFLNDGSSKSAKTFTRFEYGVTDDLVVEAVVPFKFRRPKSGSNTEGLGDVALEVKYRVIREPDAPVSVGVGFEVGFPTGDEGRGLGNGNFKYEPILSLGKVFEWGSIHQDAKLELVRETGGGVKREASTTSAIGWELADEIGGLEHVTGWLALDWKFVENTRTKLSLIPALSGEFEGLPVEIEWGVGIPIGVTDAADNWGLITSLEVEF